MRVLVCGGRDYDDEQAIATVLKDFAVGLIDADANYFTQPTIIHGNARGADRMAAKVAYSLGWDVETYPADWEKHGKAAGPIRNQQMLDSGVDLVIAFPGGRGTADMVRRAKAAGVPVAEVSHE